MAGTQLVGDEVNDSTKSHSCDPKNAGATENVNGNGNQVFRNYLVSPFGKTTFQWSITL